jgi:hypothetical protein
MLRRVHVCNLVGAAGIWDEQRVEMLESISCAQERSTQYAFMRVNHSRLTTRKPTVVATTINKFAIWNFDKWCNEALIMDI